MAGGLDCRNCKYFEKNVDLPWPVCTLHQFHFEKDFSPCDSFSSGRPGSSGASRAEISRTGTSGFSRYAGALAVFLVLGVLMYVLVPGLAERLQEDAGRPFEEDASPSAEDSVLPSGYFLPTDTEYISDADLSGFTKEEVSLIRNELFARHGCSFNSEAIRTYFEAQSWYEPVAGITSANFDAALFNEFEAKNLATILAYERSQGWRS